MFKREKLQRGKMESSVTPLQGDQLVSVTVKVNKPGYVPKGVKVRSRIDEYFFTANTPAKNLNEMSNDPLIVSFSPARTVRMIK